MIRGFHNYRLFTTPIKLKDGPYERLPQYTNKKDKDAWSRLRRTEPITPTGTVRCLQSRPTAVSPKILNSVNQWAMFSHTASRRVCLNKKLKPILFYRDRVMGSFQKLMYLYYTNSMRSFDKKTIRKRRALKIKLKKTPKLGAVGLGIHGKINVSGYFYKTERMCRYRHGYRKIHKRRRSYKKQFWYDIYRETKYFNARKKKTNIIHCWALNPEDTSPPIFTKPSDSIMIYVHPLTQLAGDSVEMVRFFTKKPKLLLGDVTGLEENITYKRLSSGILLFGEDCEEPVTKIFKVFYDRSYYNITEDCDYLYQYPESWECIDFVDSYDSEWLDISVDLLKESYRVLTPMSSYFGCGPSNLYMGGIYLLDTQVLINLRYGVVMYVGYEQIHKYLFYRENPIILDSIGSEEIKKGIFKPEMTHEDSRVLIRNHVFSHSKNNLAVGKNKRSILSTNALKFAKSKDFYKYFRNYKLSAMRKKFFYDSVYGKGNH